MLNATLLDRIDISPELVIFRFLPDAGVPDFHPGQYLAVGLPGSHPRAEWAHPENPTPDPDKIIKRAYSIASSPSQKEFIEIYVALLPTGNLTTRLATLKPNDRIFAAPKITGTFTINDIPSDHNLIFVSTGTGLAPYISMMSDPTTWSEGRHVTLIHGVRKKIDLAYQNEINALIKEGKPLRYLPFVSREGDLPAGAEKGRLVRVFHEQLIPISPETDHIMLCGNPDMVEEVEKWGIEKGFTVHSKKKPGNLHLEKYW